MTGLLLLLGCAMAGALTADRFAFLAAEEVDANEDIQLAACLNDVSFSLADALDDTHLPGGSLRSDAAKLIARQRGTAVRIAVGDVRRRDSGKEDSLEESDSRLAQFAHKSCTCCAVSMT